MGFMDKSGLFGGGLRNEFISFHGVVDQIFIILRVSNLDRFFSVLLASDQERGLVFILLILAIMGD